LIQRSGVSAERRILKGPQIEAMLAYIRQHESPTDAPPTLFGHPANPTKHREIGF